MASPAYAMADHISKAEPVNCKGQLQLQNYFLIKYFSNDSASPDNFKMTPPT